MSAAKVLRKVAVAKKQTAAARARAAKGGRGFALAGIVVVLAVLSALGLQSQAQAEHFAVEVHCQDLADAQSNAPFDFAQCREFYTKLYADEGEL